MPSRSITKWIIYALGAFALVMGAIGLISPEQQAGMMGFPSVTARSPEDHTLTLLAITSLATINTALLYVVAAAKSWPGFVGWAIGARTLMGCGLATLALCGRGPSAFVGAAIWEWIGAGIIAGAALWDRRANARVSAA